MATPKVLLKRSSVVGNVPSTSDLDYGELAINFADGKIYFKDNLNVIRSFVDSARVESIAFAAGRDGAQSAIIDSDDVLTLIDSAHVQARQTPQDFAYASLTGAPTNVSVFTNDAGYLTSALDSAEVIALIDSAYVQLRQDFAYSSLTGAPTNVSTFTNDANYLDSSTVTDVIDAAYIQSNQTTYDFLDSAEAIALIDSAHVQLRQDFAYSSLTGVPTTVSTFTNDANYLDSNTVTGVIDQTFVTGLIDTIYLDSAEAISLIDSAHVQLRQTPQDFAYSSLTGTPTNVSDFTNDANYLDSTSVTGVIDQAYVTGLIDTTYLDSAETIALIDSAYVQARQSLDFTFSDVANVAPTTGQIELGEIAINTHDGKMFFKRDADGTLSIREVGFPDRADNVLYVSENGNDSNDGSTIAEAYLTLDAALSSADSGTTIFLKSGNYTLNNTSGGVVVPTKVSIIGDNLRTTNISGQTATNDLLLLNNASYITGVTFRGHTNGAAAVSFDPSAGNIITSPYVQNCSSITTTGTGMKIDGSLVGGLRSMVSDSFTQINFGGKGIHLLNKGYAQLVSIFTVSCDVGILCEAGGNCSVTNSNCSFGNFGLKSTGSISLSKSGTASAAAIESKVVRVTGVSPAPNYGEAVKFANDTKYYTVDAISATGSPNEYDVTLLEELILAVGNGDAVTFHQRSLIQASSITFEYVGTGTGVYNTPQSGAFPIQANEVIQDSDNQGLVYFTSTDHKGDFRIGGDLTINRENGTITGNTFDKSLFAVLTPYILAIED